MKKIEFKDTDKFLPINIYKFPLGNCGGITDKIKTIYIPCETGNYTFEQLMENQDIEYIFTEEHRGGEYWCLKPYWACRAGNSPMAGGNLAYSSDSRCKRVYHVHDRFEN
jgi:hypothetical protein